MAKMGEIAGVAVATNKGNEYLRSLPDESENNKRCSPVGRSPFFIETAVCSKFDLESPVSERAFLKLFVYSLV